MRNFFKAPRGTVDILPNETKIWQKVRETATLTCENFGFHEIILPTFEEKQLFIKSIEEGTDIVKKEMFCFNDLGGRELALRPEGTACVARAVIEHGLLNNPLPLKLFYIFNCFRNERPQTGRFKEFYQFGVELFGSKWPIAEFEIISLAATFFKTLKIKNLNLNLNSIGCENCRNEYIIKLRNYFKQHIEKICDNCKNRLIKNPLRILDCKNKNCKLTAKNSPNILEYICNECKDHFKEVCSLLKYNNIDFEINPFIVRGLDYYTRTVFEFTTNELGSQNAICGGGRYDNLLKKIGKNDMPSIGFGIGVNRLIMLLQKNYNFKQHSYDVYIGNTKEESLKICCEIAQKLREQNISVATNLLKKSVKAQMKYANKINAIFSCIIGEEEIINNKICIKNMFNSKNYIISIKNFINEFTAILNE